MTAPTLLLLLLDGCAATWVLADGKTTDSGDDPPPTDDLDQDGWSARDGDCDDGDPEVNPGAPEVCDPDDRDEDCDALADDADGGATGKSLTFLDRDRDGWGADDDPGVTACDPPPDQDAARAGDCDDEDPVVNPAAADPTDGAGGDDDCDGYVDEDGLAPGVVLFTELYWRGGDTSENYVPTEPWQWVELASRAAVPMWLDGWELVLCHVGGGSVTAVPDATSCLPGETSRLRFPAGTRLDPGQRFVACSPEVDFPCDATWTWTGGAMSFRNGYVALRADGVTLGPAASTAPTELGVDDLGYYYRDSLDYWPNAAGASMRLDDDAFAAATGPEANDHYGSAGSSDGAPIAFTTWCFAASTPTFTVGGTTRQGSPGAENGLCP